MYYSLVSNGMVVLFLSGVVMWVDLSLNKKYSQYVLGVMFGLITIFVMLGHIDVEGRNYDFRLITMTMAGFIGGPVTAVIAALISSFFRFSMGGTGSVGGISNIITFACFGSILGSHLRRSNQNGKKLLFWFMIGIVMTGILFLLIVLNTLLISGPIAILRVIAVPFLIITPLATTIIFNFYFWTYDFFGKAAILNTIINYSPINLLIFDAHGPILFSKNSTTQLQTYLDIENPNSLLDPDKSRLNTKNQYHKEITTEDERHFVADLSSFQMPSGEYACLAIINDVTDRKREQEKYRGATDRFAKAFNLGPHMMAIVRQSDYRYIDVNHRFLEERGFTREDVIGKTPIEMGMPESEFKQIVETLEVQGTVQNVECTLVTKFGSIGTEILSAEKIHLDKQECILFAYIDITEMKRMQTEKVEQLTKYLCLEADLSRSNQLIADIMNQMPDGFYALDNQWRFTFVNKKAEELLLKTREELLGKVLWNTIPQSQGTLLELNYQKAKKDREPITFEYLGFLQNDIWYQVTVYPSQFGLSVYYKDITERRLEREKLNKSQEEMARLDRLNLVGQLAAGIGHEIRNPMTTVRGYLQLLGVKPEYAAQKSTFELMISELDRANSIITEFLSLAQTKQSELRTQNLNDILNHLFPLLEADAFTQNKQLYLIPGEIPNLELNSKEISQLILNLTRNGFEAMQENGCLTIESYLQDGMVVLAIEDEGCGIPPENNSKLGTPFFTTKDYGTGLGLATCYKIVESHNAKVCVDSNHRGTTFYVSFPIPDKEQEKYEMIAK